MYNIFYKNQKTGGGGYVKHKIKLVRPKRRMYNKSESRRRSRRNNWFQDHRWLGEKVEKLEKRNWRLKK
jgi:hypothetical protein